MGQSKGAYGRFHQRRVKRSGEVIQAALQDRTQRQQEVDIHRLQYERRPRACCAVSCPETPRDLPFDDDGNGL